MAILLFANACAPAERIKLDGLDIPTLPGTRLTSCPPDIDVSVCVSAAASDELRVFNGYADAVTQDGWSGAGGAAVELWFEKNGKRLTLGFIEDPADDSKMLVVFVSGR